VDSFVGEWRATNIRPEAMDCVGEDTKDQRNNEHSSTNRTNGCTS
jgi:hypothetical protein